MAIENESGGLENIRRQMAAHADALKGQAAAVLQQKAAEIRQAIGPQKTDPVRQPERPFGRDEGGEDVKQVVWTGHTVETPEGRTYFGAAGLTQAGYYRAADVQAYGPDELWRWQLERYADKADAIASAETLMANRLAADEARQPMNGATEPAWREFFEKEQTNMAEIPEHVKAEAERAAANVNKAEIKMADAGPSVNERADAYDAKAMEAQREQQRQNALEKKGPEPER